MLSAGPKTSLKFQYNCQIGTSKSGANVDLGQTLADFAQGHAAFKHPLFQALQTTKLTAPAAGRILKNYDAHASHLRRLLLKAATIMPESAVGFILENVRNEYGNGVDSGRHQLQLQDLAGKAGNSREDYRQFAIEEGVRQFIKIVTPYYFPLQISAPNYDCALSERIAPLCKAAIAAGAITATELMAVEEFKALQIAFSHFDLQDHIWFDHVQVEAEHSGESIALALYFLENPLNFDAVEFGLLSVLEANIHLYDGLLQALA